MLSLIRRQEAFQHLAIWLVHTGLTTSVLLGALAWSRAAGRTQAVPPALLLAVAWLSLAVFLVAGKVRRRCSDLELALPLPTRQLWLAHVVAVVMTAAGLVVVMIGVIGIHRWGLGESPVESAPAASLIGLTALLITGLLLAVVLIESRRIDLQSPPIDWRDVLWRFSVVAAVATVSLALSQIPLAGSLILLLATTMIAGRTGRRLPGTFLVLPRAGDDRGPSAARERGEWVAGGSLGSARLIGRLFVVAHGARFGALAPVLMLPFIVVFGAIAAGVLGDSLEDIRLLYLPLFVYMLFNSVPGGMEQLAHLDPLPLSRRVLFALLVLPLLSSFAVGYGLGALTLELRGKSGDRIEYLPQRGESHHWLSVPVEHNRIAWSAGPPEVTSPWGETYTPHGFRIVRGAPAYAYSPFSTPEGSSPEFVALQVSRAVQAVYGARIEPDEIQRRYLEVTEDGVRPRGKGLTLEQDYGLEPVPAGPEFPALLALVGVPFLLLVALFQRSYRAGRGARVKKIFWIAVLTFSLGLLILQLALAIADVMEPWGIRALLKIPLQQAGTSVPGRAAVWLLSAALLAVGYRVAESAFAESELPVKPTVIKLI